jgi:hypothetical protein
MSKHAPSFFEQRPVAGELNPYYTTYTGLVPDGNLLSMLTDQHAATQQALRGLTDAQALFRPAPAEWSVKQVVGHLIDSERIFAYRALRFARKDATALPGMEPDPYVAAARFDSIPLADLLAEYAALRVANVFMFAGFDEAAWLRGGVASDNPITARALGWIIAGHELHHLASLREKYLAK